jgi:hypothetical protein
MLLLLPPMLLMRVLPSRAPQKLARAQCQQRTSAVSMLPVLLQLLQLLLRIAL